MLTKTIFSSLTSTIIGLVLTVMIALLLLADTIREGGIESESRADCLGSVRPCSLTELDMSCWSSCGLRPSLDSLLDNLLPDGKYEKRKVSEREVEEWSLTLRENRLTLEEDNIRKRQTEILKMIGLTVKGNKGKLILESLNLHNIRMEVSLKESRERQKDEPLNDFEQELNFREKSLREAEEVLKDMLDWYQASFKLADDKNTVKGLTSNMI